MVGQAGWGNFGWRQRREAWKEFQGVWPHFSPAPPSKGKIYIYAARISGPCEQGPSLPPDERPRMCGRAGWLGMPVPYSPRVSPAMFPRPTWPGRQVGKHQLTLVRQHQKSSEASGRTFQLHHLQRVKSKYMWRGLACHASWGCPSRPVTGQEFRGGESFWYACRANLLLHRV